MTELDLDLDLAYVFTPPPRPHSAGHPRLIIRLRRTPTGRHFDPEQVLIPVYLTTGSGDPMRITHPWQGPEACPVSPGRVILRDRNGKTAEAFTFGGNLKITSGEAETICDLTSPAPILNITDSRSLAEFLAEEVEILLAGLYGAWGEQREALEERLAATDPQELYRACLNSLSEKLKHFPVVEGSLPARLNRLVQSELHALQEQTVSSASQKTLAELFPAP